MEEFSIIQPSPALAPYVKNYWPLKTVCDSIGGEAITTVARTVPTEMRRHYRETRRNL